MKTIDGKNLGPEAQELLTNAALGGGAFVVLKSGAKVAVIDGELWSHLEEQLPSVDGLSKRLKSS